MKLKAAKNRRRNRRGTALVMAIVMSVVITGMIMTLAWAGGVQAEMTGNLLKLDQAFYTAESGAQRVSWYVKHSKISTATSPLTGLVGTYAYSAGWTTTSGSTRVTSIGSLGNVSYTCYQTVAPPALMPVAATAGDFDNKNIAVTGDIVTGGTYTTGGSGSLSGNVYYTTQFSTSLYHLNMTTLGTALYNAAGTKYNGSQANMQIDFNQVPAVSGTNKVVYVNGSVANITFKGSGTLYVTGAAALGSLGTSTEPVNIVVAGSVSLTNNTIYGSIYTAGDLSMGHFDMTGLIYNEGTYSRSNSGKSSLTMTAPPWFDSRASGGGAGGSGTTTLTSFAGPLP